MRLTTAIALAALTPAALSAQTQIQTAASITSAVIEACYVKSSGSIYRINAQNAPSKCSTNSTPFSWNVQGPQGPAGPQGPQGPQGPEGPAGTSGMSGYEVKEQLFTNLPQGEWNSKVVICSPGKAAVGGGFVIDNDVTHQILGSKPAFTGQVTYSVGWNVNVKNLAGLDLRVFVVCVTAPS